MFGSLILLAVPTLTIGVLGKQVPRYIGCYEDRWSRALEHKGPKIGDVEPCIHHCISKNFIYAGVESGDECYCGNGTYAQHGMKTGECTDPCPQNSKLTCGGDWRVAVYRAECMPGLWGRNPVCSLTCGQCKNNICNLGNGTCDPPFCKKSWEPPQCTKCLQGKFGENCESICHCFDNSVCDHVTGSCPDDKCAPGWKGGNCSIECQAGNFGENCESACHCFDNSVCNHVTGSCPHNKCAPGWKGDNCSTVEIPVPSLDGRTGPGVVAGAVIGVCFVLLVLAVALFLVLRRYRQKFVGEDSVSLDSLDMEVPVNAGIFGSEPEAVYYNKIIARPIKLENLYNRIEQERSKEKPFAEEYKELPRNQQALWTIGELASKLDKEKNRFKNIFPYDHSRVILSQLSDDPISDYINASHIQGYASNESLIATQGPTEKTVNDFWRMIWEQQVHFVVMLTNLVEEKKKKCAQYWPETQQQQYGELTVKMVKTQIWPDFIMRQMTMIKGGEQRVVKQFHFTGWPDHGVPHHATALLNFHHKVRAEMQNVRNFGPVTVHCSAGIGRTGTFLAIDYLLQQAATEQLIDVCTCVNLMRASRVNMVQTREQYMFVYTAVFEALFVGVTLIPCFEFSELYARMLTPDPYSNSTKLEQQFQLLGLIKSKKEKSTD